MATATGNFAVDAVACQVHLAARTQDGRAGRWRRVMADFAAAVIELEDALDRAADRADREGLEPAEVIAEVKRWLHAYEQSA